MNTLVKYSKTYPYILTPIGVNWDRIKSSQKYFITLKSCMTK